MYVYDEPEEVVMKEVNWRRRFSILALCGLLALLASVFVAYYLGHSRSYDNGYEAGLAAGKKAEMLNAAAKPKEPALPVSSVPTVPTVPVEVVAGDTFSDLVHDFYGNGTERFFRAAARVVSNVPQPFDPEKIEVGQVIYFPCERTIDGVHLQGSLAQAKRRWHRRHRPIAKATSPDFENPSPSIENAQSVQTLAAPEINSEANSAPILLVLNNAKPLHPELLAVKSPETPNAKSYVMSIPREVAQGLPVKTDLETCLTYEDGSKKCGLTSQVRKTKDGNYALWLPFRKIPDQPFEVAIGGIPAAINREDMLAYAVPSNKGVPGQSMFPRLLTSVERVAVPSLLMSATMGPVIGISLGAGPVIVPPAVKWIAHHVIHRKKSQRRISYAD